MHCSGPFLHCKLILLQPESSPGQVYCLPSLQIALVHEHTPFSGAAYIQEQINVVRNCKCQVTSLHLDDLEQTSQFDSSHGFTGASLVTTLQPNFCMCPVLLLSLSPQVGVNLEIYPNNHFTWGSPTPRVLIYLQHSLHTVCNPGPFEENL